MTIIPNDSGENISLGGRLLEGELAHERFDGCNAEEDDQKDV